MPFTATVIRLSSEISLEFATNSAKLNVGVFSASLKSMPVAFEPMLRDDAAACRRVARPFRTSATLSKQLRGVGELSAEQDGGAMPLAARIDDGDRRPPAVPPYPRVPGVEPSWAPAHLCLALSESGSGDNNAGSFSGWPGDAFLPE